VGSWKVSTPSIRRGRHEERRPRPFIASSRVLERGWKRPVFVVEVTGLQAVVELAEELVEQVPLCLVVPVADGAAGIEVAAGAGRGAQRSQGPDRADRGQAPVFDVPVQHHGFLAAGAGDRRGAGEGFQPAGVGEKAVVVADLGQHPGTGQVPETGKDISWSEESSSHRERGPNAWVSL
jgi:hypothetical protein